MELSDLERDPRAAAALRQRRCAWSPTRAPTSPSAASTQKADGFFASGSFFDTLGVRALLGRTFSDADDRRGGGPDGPVAVISYGFWQRHFGGAADASAARSRSRTCRSRRRRHAAGLLRSRRRPRRSMSIVPLGTEPLVSRSDEPAQARPDQLAEHHRRGSSRIRRSTPRPRRCAASGSRCSTRRFPGLAARRSRRIPRAGRFRSCRPRPAIRRCASATSGRCSRSWPSSRWCC